MEQRRVLLAFVLMALVLVASQWWYSQLGPPPGEEVGPADTTKMVEAEEPRGGERGAPADTAARPAPPVETPADTIDAGVVENALLEPGAAPPAVRVETPLYRARLDPEGGVLRQIELLRYASFTADAAPVALVPDGEAFLDRTVDLGESTLRLGRRTFVPSDSIVRLAEGDPTSAVTFTWEGGGRRIVQTYRFAPDTYVVDYRLELSDGGDGVVVTGIAPRLHSNEKKPEEDYSQMRAVAYVDGEILTKSAEDAAEANGLSIGGSVDWSGLKSKYFLGLLMAPPEGPTLTAVRVEGSPGDSLPRLDVGIAAPLKSGASAYRLYFGPQEYDRLRALGGGLDEVNQYGWSWIQWAITPFAKIAVVVMLWLHQFVPVWGLVLILFAVVVRLLMWPLTAKSYRSIQAMQKIQPEIQRIRDQYSDDPQQMQKETMRLYREKKVNPLGGCLPNLIPMPILFALFFVFQTTIEFRGQAFLWLPDLSQPDPLYALPVFMGLTMFATSKMTATDPKMSAMVYVMPVVLTFVFMNLAAGLVLYYAFSNLLTFGQQYWLRRVGGEEPDEEEG
ncbi:MAG: membrane protein insertase YidC [Gemmatimonadota bacterium]|nr:membrane protein insertase YidC [Gemmatimonadota bacterium]